MTKDKAIEILKTCEKDGNLKKRENVGKTMKIEIYLCEGWEYTFFCDNNEIKKIEAYNHRELIEEYVK